MSAPKPAPFGLNAALLATCVALGVDRSRRGWAPPLAWVVSILLGAAAGGVGLAAARETSGVAPVGAAVRFAANLVAWGPAVIVAFRGAAGAFLVDAADGLEPLALLRGCKVTNLRAGRVLGLAIVLSTLVLSGAFVAWAVVLVGAARIHTGAALVALVKISVYGCVYGLTLASVTLALGGGRTARTAYPLMASALALPVFAGLVAGTHGADNLRDLASIPSALAALQGGLLDPSVDLERGARGIAAASVLMLVSGAIIWRSSLKRVALVGGER